MGLSPILVTSILTVLQRLTDGGLSILLVEQNATPTFEANQRCLVMETRGPHLDRGGSPSQQ